MQVAIDSEVATLASGDHVGGVLADRFALAEVGHCQDDLTACVAGFGVVDFSTSTVDFCGLVQTTLPGTLAASLGAG